MWNTTITLLELKCHHLTRLRSTRRYIINLDPTGPSSLIPILALTLPVMIQPRHGDAEQEIEEILIIFKCIIFRNILINLYSSLIWFPI